MNPNSGFPFHGKENPNFDSAVNPNSGFPCHGKGAENGLLIKGGDSLESINNVNTIVFDKTGTLTVGKPKVSTMYSEVNLKGTGYNDEKLLFFAGSAELGSEHPLARAIIEEANQKGIILKNPTEFDAVPGKGLKQFFLPLRFLILSLEQRQIR